MPFFLKSGKDLQSLCQLDRIHEKRCFKKTKSKLFCIIATSFKVALFDRKAWHGSTEIANRAIKKPVTLDGVEFLRRFAMHILPKRFVKIRRYGIYNHTTKRNLKLQFVRDEKPGIGTLIKQKQPKETNLERFERLTGVNPCLCPVCKSGRMAVVREFPRIRSPVLWGGAQTPAQY